MGENENNKSQQESPVLKWFRNAILGAAMADQPAMMTASGWRQDEKGDYIQDQQDDPHVKQLRDNLASEGVGVMLGEFGIPALYGLYKLGIKGLGKAGFGQYNWFTKKFYPHKAKRLDELQHQRQFIKEHPYEYVSDNTVREAIESANDGTHLYRGVIGDRGIPYSRIKSESNFSTGVEFIDPRTQTLMYDNIPSPTAWTSTNPNYVRGLTAREIHIQPQKDFTFIKLQNPNRRNAGYVNSYDPSSRIVNASGFNLESGDHFIRIPGANSYARMKEGVKYNTADAYTSPISKYSTLFPGIQRGPNGWNIHKAYKLGLIGSGAAAGMFYWLK